MAATPFLVVVLGSTMILTPFGYRLRSHSILNPFGYRLRPHNDFSPLLIIVFDLTRIIALFGRRLRPHNDYNPIWLSSLVSQWATPLFFFFFWLSF